MEQIKSKKLILLVSSRFPSGVAWLMNFFLELDIMVYFGKDSTKIWHYDEKNSVYALQDKQSRLKQWCPVFQSRTTFPFQENIAVKLTHEFPSLYLKDHPTLLFVRDGRDSVYSMYRREIKGMSFSEFLQQRVSPFQLVVPENWAALYLLWQRFVPPELLLTVKFEEVKTDPIPYVKGVLSFLNIHKTDEEIQKAVESCDFERAKQAEQVFQKSLDETNVLKKRTINRSGKVAEWKTSYTPEQLDRFLGFPEILLKDFNYETISSRRENSLLKKTKIIKELALSLESKESEENLTVEEQNIFSLIKLGLDKLIKQWGDNVSDNGNMIIPLVLNLLQDDTFYFNIVSCLLDEKKTQLHELYKFLLHHVSNKNQLYELGILIAKKGLMKDAYPFIRKSKKPGAVFRIAWYRIIFILKKQKFIVMMKSFIFK